VTNVGEARQETSRPLDRAYCGSTCLGVLDIASKITKPTKDCIVTLVNLSKSLINRVPTLQGHKLLSGSKRVVRELDRLTVPVEVVWFGWNGVSYRLPLVCQTHLVSYYIRAPILLIVTQMKLTLVYYTLLTIWYLTRILRRSNKKWSMMTQPRIMHEIDYPI
jgi:hypothetical protein